jgi:hypothetical protein
MMKRTVFIGLLLLLLLPQVGLAQTTPSAIERLQIALWPDYDRASVLVLLTGEFPADTALPTTATIPLPENADFNVVARIDAADGNMKDDIEFSTDGDQLTFTTPDLRFRIEYYMPYDADDTQRSFEFSWSSALAVNQLQLDVQQPRSAGGLLTEPAATNVFTGDDGFIYHSLPVQNVAAGEPVSVRVDYTMDSPLLSTERTGPQITDVQTTGFDTASNPASEPNWPLIVGIGAGLLLIAIAITWRVAAGRGSSRPRKPRPVRAEGSSSSVRYCHICGQPIHSGDKFCRECGTPVKTS